MRIPRSLPTGRLDRLSCLFAIPVIAVLAFVDCAAAEEAVRIMSFNMWQGGDSGRQPFERTVEVVRAAKADIVGLQETGGIAPKGQPRPDHAKRLADALGWHYHRQESASGMARIGIISRFPIGGTLGEPSIGATVTLPSGRTVDVFNIHMVASPYQPYQLLGIPYGDAAFLKTPEEAVAAAREAREAQVDEVIRALKGAKSSLQIITGDFNEPSHLDWTEETVKERRHPAVVEWPSPKTFAAAGFRAAYRTLFPDPVARPGMTWTTLTRPDDPKDHHDRIDFVLSRGPAKVKSAEVVGHSPGSAEIVVSPYPSDHRAVVATFVVEDKQD